MKKIQKYLESIGFITTARYTYLNHYDGKRVKGEYEEWVTIVKRCGYYECSIYNWISASLGKREIMKVATYQEIINYFKKYL